MQAELERAVAQTGVPRAILSDGGKDVKKAVFGFCGVHADVAALSDIKHKTALLVKAELKADDRWRRFLLAVGRTKSQMQQTELACLVPASLKDKARYMNLAEMVNWGRRTLRYLDTPPDAREPVAKAERLEKKLGWLREYREALDQWGGMMAVVNATLEVIRRDGYHGKAAETLRDRLSSMVRDELSRRVAELAVTFVSEQSQSAEAAEHLPANTECLESLIGKGKRLEGQQSRSGFTKMVLGMAASVVEPTVEHVRTALEKVKTKDVIAWCKEKLGCSVQSLRQRALPPLIKGTITG